MRGHARLDLLHQPRVGARAVEPDRPGERRAFVGAAGILPMAARAVGRAVEQPFAPRDAAVGHTLGAGAGGDLRGGGQGPAEERGEREKPGQLAHAWSSG